MDEEGDTLAVSHAAVPPGLLAPVNRLRKHSGTSASVRGQ